MSTIAISGRPIGEGCPPYIIAEMSGNHNGDLARALDLVDAAKAAGADAVKLQTYTADTITLDHDGPGFTIEQGLWRGRKLYDLYSEASTPWDWHAAIFERANEVGITAFSSPFDHSAVSFLEDLGAPAYKIASFELVDLPLIERVAQTGKPMIMSSGMATLVDIEDALAAARQAGAEEIILLHCISGYPTPLIEANLRRIGALRDRFEVMVGLSDHTLGTVVSAAAVALGAVAIEKHFTMRRSDGGADSAFSLEAAELADLCRICRETYESLGSALTSRTDSEQENAGLRRSLYIVRDIPAGTTLTDADVRSIRPGLGLPPKHYKDVLGRRILGDTPRGTPLAWNLLEGDLP